MAYDPSKLRNFSIIAHIDHGKSTLADRILQLSGAVEQRQMRSQYLDRMDIERERGITIKSQAVTVPWIVNGVTYTLNMIDTPGHVDFNYEVSRSLAACEATILLIDATQGIEAQTIANLYLAMENNLTIIPVLNKIDLPASNTELYKKEISSLLGVSEDEILTISAKTGEGVARLLDKLVAVSPPPLTDIAVADKQLRAMIFDSVYDIYRGVITYVKIIEGSLHSREKIRMMSTSTTHELLEIGIMNPEPFEVKTLRAGEVGYLITGIKEVSQSKVGDTVTTEKNPASEILPGFSEPKPMVFSGLFPIDGDDYTKLREALDKLKLNDAALTYLPETSTALGFGFRVGFLGMLHLEIIQERLEREFDLSLISTPPNVNYLVVTEGGNEIQVTNPSDFPDGKVLSVLEPTVIATILTPSDYIGTVMELVRESRGTAISTEYITDKRVELTYKIPLQEVVFNFFDKLKSRTRGFASLDYEPNDMQESNLVRMDILLAGDKVDALAMISHREKAETRGRQIAEKLKSLIPRQQFEIPIQVAIGSKIIARETIRALRKDVLAKCYGGDISRKRKLLEKQKEGKKRMKTIGKVDLPQEAFIAAVSSDSI